MKILILRFSSIGDIVLTTPLVRALKRQVKDVELHYATKAIYKGIVQSNPYIDKVHILEDNMNRLVLDLQQEEFDLVLDLHHNIRTQIIKLRLRVKSISVNKLNLKKWLLTQFKIDKLPKYKHIVDRYLYTAKALGVTNDDGGLDYFIPRNDEVSMADLIPNTKKGLVAIAIGAKFFTKRLPYPKIVSICDHLNYPIILLGGLDDWARGDEIVRRSKNQRIFNACGQLNLNQSASVVKQADVLITHDTGLMHIAAAFKKKTVSVWGNTVPEFGMYPYQKEENFKVVEVKGLSCRPCSKIGYKKCPKGHFDCMQKIDALDVVRATVDYLKPV